jgi:hypothetical protein
VAVDDDIEDTIVEDKLDSLITKLELGIDVE